MVAHLTLPPGGCHGVGSKEASPAGFERTPSGFRRTPSAIKDARDRSHGVDMVPPQPASESKRLGGAGVLLFNPSLMIIRARGLLFSLAG